MKEPRAHPRNLINRSAELARHSQGFHETWIAKFIVNSNIPIRRAVLPLYPIRQGTKLRQTSRYT